METSIYLPSRPTKAAAIERCAAMSLEDAQIRRADSSYTLESLCVDIPRCFVAAAAAVALFLKPSPPQSCRAHLAGLVCRRSGEAAGTSVCGWTEDVVSASAAL